jgi:hypothetical protein
MRKLLAALVVLTVGTAFAAVDLHTWNGLQAGKKWTVANNWTPAGPPGAGDSVIFDGSAATPCSVDVGVTPGVVLVSGATSTIIMVASGALSCTKLTVTATSGGIQDNGKAVTVAGDLVITGSTGVIITSTGAWTVSASANISNATAGNKVGSLVISDAGATGIKATRTANFYAGAVTIGQNDSIVGAFTTYVVPGANDFMTVVAGGATSGGETEFRIDANYTLAALSLGESLTVHGAGNCTLALTGNLSVRGFTLSDSMAFNDGGDTVVPGYKLTIPGTNVVSTGAWKMTDSGSVASAATLYRFLTDNGASGMHVRLDGDFNVADIAVGQNDTVITTTNLLKIESPDSNDFLTLASGATITGSDTGGGVYVTLDTVGGDVILSNTAFAVACPVMLNLNGDSLTATGAWTTTRRVTTPMQLEGTGLSDRVDLGTFALTARALSFDFSSVAATGFTFLAGSGTHVVDTVLPVAPYANFTFALENSVWRVAEFDVNPGLSLDSFFLTSTGAVIRLQNTTNPNIKLSVSTIPTVRCSADKPTIYGGVGGCSTLVVTSICDTVFLDTMDTGDSINVWTTFTANGTRGTTVLYGNGGTDTNVHLPVGATVTNCKLANIVARGTEKLKAYGNIPAGHLSRVAIRR